MDGALTTSANSAVVLAGGASTCNVWWTPTQATTLGATSTFAGIDIDAAGINIGSTVNWTGRALAFGGTVTTDVDTITADACPGLDVTPLPPTTTPLPDGDVPGLPNTAYASAAPYLPWIAGFALLTIIVISVYLVRKKV